MGVGRGLAWLQPPKSSSSCTGCGAWVGWTLGCALAGAGAGSGWAHALSLPHGLLLPPEIESESIPNVLLFDCVGAGAAAGMGCCRGGEMSFGGGAGLGSKKLPPLSELFCCAWPVGEARPEKDDAAGRGGDCILPNRSAFSCGFGAAVVGGADCMALKSV